MSKKYLKEKELLAVPFDKGVGIRVMKKGTYHEKFKIRVIILGSVANKIK